MCVYVLVWVGGVGRKRCCFRPSSCWCFLAASLTPQLSNCHAACRPQRPDAAVLVGATDDAYVSPGSLLELHAHWPGSEVRFVPGGHVSAFLLHQRQFRAAISDSLARL